MDRIVNNKVAAIIKAIEQIESAQLPKLSEDQIIISEQDMAEIELRKQAKGCYELPNNKMTEALKKNQVTTNRASTDGVVTKRYAAYIGIDPDIDKSGIATWEPGSRTLSVDIITFPHLVAVLHDIYKIDTGNTKVILEAGWLNKQSNFHKWINPAVDMRVAAKVGQNHAVGKLIEQFLIEYDIPYELVRPRAGKWDAAQFKTFTGLTQRTNSEMRDAAKLVFGI